MQIGGVIHCLKVYVSMCVNDRNGIPSGVNSHTFLISNFTVHSNPDLDMNRCLRKCDFDIHFFRFFRPEDLSIML